MHLKKDKTCQQHQILKLLKITGIQITFNKLPEIKIIEKHFF